jgi:hypothetical protein
MICHELSLLCSSDARGVRNAHVNSFSPRALMHGSTMHELKCISDLSVFELDCMHAGKIASIVHMLEGGNGFASNPYNTPMARVPFDNGCVIERNDIRSMKAWATDLSLAMEDRRRGRVA